VRFRVECGPNQTKQGEQYEIQSNVETRYRSGGRLATGIVDHGGRSPEEHYQGTSSLSKKEVKFINDAAEGGLMEVRMGELAQQKGQSADVKSLGQKLVTDHKRPATN